MSTEQHASITVREDMLIIVKAWPVLAAAVAKGGTLPESKVKSSRPAHMPITVGVVDLMSEIEQWVNFLARVLLDETAKYDKHGRKVAGWEPAHDTMPGMLRDIADWRVGHFTEHADQQLALAVVEEAGAYRRRVVAAATPSGKRWIPLHIACFEHITTEQGERAPCPGEYRAPLDPDRPGLVPDMVCDQDKTHRISPLDWQRAGRKSGYDAARIRERLAISRGGAA